MINTLLFLAALQSSGLPEFPSWMSSKGTDHMYYRSAPYKWAIKNIPDFAADMFGTGVGHAMAYEALVTGKSDILETRIFDKIVFVLKSPPKLPIVEADVSPKFVSQFGYLEKVFDWAHLLHFQIIDVLMYPGWSNARKETEIKALWNKYKSEPYAITGLPMNMEVLDGFDYSANFRKKYPKVNGLFWGYHWLQTVNYDMLFGILPKDQEPQYELIGNQYRETELFKTDRDYMPMMAEMSPRFSKAFPEIANAFDNLHMLHDNVNDILATEKFSNSEKELKIKEAIVRVLESSHLSCKSDEGVENSIHDHRHPPSQPGMGYMKGMDGDEMYMSGMGWMNMSECAHCSIPMPDGPNWGATVTANGWTMNVRCLMCARDMAAETPGRAIIRAATEDPYKTLVLVSDEMGNYQTNYPQVVFLEEVGEHPACSVWSKAFTSKSAFDKFVEANPEFLQAKPLSLKEWQSRNNGTPNTYRKINKPNPYNPIPPRTNRR